MDAFDGCCGCLQAHNIAMRADSSASLMSNVGRWLDRGINKLMGAPEGAHPSHPQTSAVRPPGGMSHHGGLGTHGAAPLQGVAGAGSLSLVAPGRTGEPALQSFPGQVDAQESAGYRRSASESNFQKV